MPAILPMISLLLPVLVPGIVLLLELRFGWARRLDVPVDHGAVFRGQPLFGRKKTWRGIITYLAGSAVVGGLLGLPWMAGFAASVFRDHPGFLVGLMTGAAYCAGELANSFVKRRLGIHPSRTTASRWRVLQYLIDLADGIAVAAVVYILLGVHPVPALLAGAVGLAVHLVTDVFKRRLDRKHD